MPEPTRTVSFIGTTVLWGTGGAGYNAGGICTNASIGKTAQKDTVPNEDGATTGYAVYDTTYSGSATIIMTSDTTAPAIGAKITIGSITAWVMDVKTDWTNNGKTQLTVSIEGGVNIPTGD